MTDHTHNWSTRYLRSTMGDCVEIYCTLTGCKKKMTWKEAKRRLNEYEVQKDAPSTKISDGDVWLIFPDAMLSIEGICSSGAPGPIVKRNLKKWRDALLKGE